MIIVMILMQYFKFSDKTQYSKGYPLPATRSPFATGMDSPLTGASLMLERPPMTTPSVGINSLEKNLPDNERGEPFSPPEPRLPARPAAMAGPKFIGAPVTQATI